MAENHGLHRDYKRLLDLVRKFIIYRFSIILTALLQRKERGYRIVKKRF